MRRIGSGLMVVGLFLLIVSLFISETGAGGSEAASRVDLLFYGGGACCLLGAIVFSARKLFGRP